MFKNFSCIFFYFLYTITIHANISHKITPSGPTKTKIEPIDELQNKYNNIKSAAFSFTQNYIHPIFPINEESKGQVFYKHGKMKWLYEWPLSRKRAFYIAGNEFVYHLMNDAVAYKHPCFQQDTLTAAIPFLSGKGKIKDSFNASLLTDSKLNPNLIWIRLIPKEKQSAIKSIDIGKDKNSHLAVESIVNDPNNGKNHFKFSNIKLNPVLNDSIFIFKPEKNVRLEQMPQVSCPEKKAAPPVKKKIPR